MQKLKTCAPPEVITRQPGTIPDQVTLAVQRGSAPPVAVEVRHVSPSTPPAESRTPQSAAVPAPTKSPYRASPRELRYLEAVHDILAFDGRLSSREIGKRLKLSHPTILEMRKKPGFLDWVNDEIRSGTDSTWPLLVERAMKLGLRGQIDFMNFVAKVRGEFKDSGGIGPGSGEGLHVHLHV